MIAIFVQLLPFFFLIGLGYLAIRLAFLPQEAVAYMSRFVFFVPLPAMLFDFVSSLPVEEIFNLPVALAYGGGSLLVYLVAFVVAKLRGCGRGEAVVESQCSVIGNVGFLGIPLLVMLFGEPAAAPILLVLAIDLIVFGSLIIIGITSAEKKGSREDNNIPGKEGTTLNTLKLIIKGLLANPMIVAILVGLMWSALALPIPQSLKLTIDILSPAATPCALLAIGGSLAIRSAERVYIATWLSFLKLVVHPLVIALFAIALFDIDPFWAAIMVASAAMPVAGNIFLIAQHYNVAPQRVSGSILVSTVASLVTLTAAIAWAMNWLGMVG